MVGESAAIAVMCAGATIVSKISLTDAECQCLIHQWSRHSLILLRKSLFYGLVLDLLLMELPLRASMMK
jgi:hypothetical protein